jgi:hypothetical protein
MSSQPCMGDIQATTGKARTISSELSEKEGDRAGPRPAASRIRRRSGAFFDLPCPLS